MEEVREEEGERMEVGGMRKEEEEEKEEVK